MLALFRAKRVFLRLSDLGNNGCFLFFSGVVLLVFRWMIVSLKFGIAWLCEDVY